MAFVRDANRVLIRSRQVDYEIRSSTLLIGQLHFGMPRHIDLVVLPEDRKSQVLIFAEGLQIGLVLFDNFAGQLVETTLGEPRG